MNNWFVRSSDSSQAESEFVLRRLSEAFPYVSLESSPAVWLGVTGLVLIGLLCFVGWQYRREARSIGWYFSVPLALARMTVFVLLAVAFLLPAVQTWEISEKRSRVVLLLDVSPSVTQVSDDIVQGVKGATRLQKILDYLNSDQSTFLSRIMEKNPLVVYRFGSRLDDEAETLTKEQRWSQDDWQAWARYNFKTTIVRGLSESGRAALEAMPSWKGTEGGDADWAVAWTKLPESETIPANLEPADRQLLQSQRSRIEKRVDVARAIVNGTDVPGSLVQALNREAANMLQGVIVISDGRSNVGSSASYTELAERLKREQIPIFTVTLGDARDPVAITLGELQAPDRAAPDEPFKIILEADGVGLSNQEA